MVWYTYSWLPYTITVKYTISNIPLPGTLCMVPTYSDLAAERHQLSASLQESHKLASQVDHLGTQLDQVNGEKQKVCT